MKQFIQSILPKEFYTNTAYIRALILGVLYLLVAITQLYTYEKFTGVIEGFGLPGGNITAEAVAVLSPLAACAALPYLLSMRMGLYTRMLSRVAVLVAPSLWLIITVWQNFAPNASKLNTGIFGATIPIAVGLWAIAFTLLWVWTAVQIVRELPPRS